MAKCSSRRMKSYKMPLANTPLCGLMIACQYNADSGSGSGCLFPPFFAVYLEIDSFWSKKVSVGLHERKILLNKS